MHEQAQLRVKKDELEKAGAVAFVVVSMDLDRTTVFQVQSDATS